MQVRYYSTGGFVIHKIKLAGSLAKFSAYYDKDGNMIDAQRIDCRDRSTEVQQDSEQWPKLDMLGKVWCKRSTTQTA